MEEAQQQQPQRQPQQPAAKKPSLFSNRRFLYLAILVVIIAVIAVLLFGGTGGSSGAQLSQFDGQPVSQGVMAQLAIPNSVSASVGGGFATNFPKATSGAPALTLNGKPEVLYIGADYCPFCAVQRWALVMALMRFGSFTGLEYMTSSATDSYSNTPTFTFANATYTSQYISFVGRETTTNVYNSTLGGYPELQKLNASENAILAKYNVPSPSCPTGGCIPFVDYANVSYDVGGNYGNPNILANMNWSAIASNLNNANTTQAQALVGAANLVTAQICMLTNNTPGSVCGQAYVKSLESELG
ncbi:MAG: DUF929 family protein [Candidatus Micrarchaeota archaeon]|nr:DUF929 family protein [Candidatus Micrarchaeota archaeon]